MPEKGLLYWDDTVIMIDTKRGCLRFYGDERIALYCVHRQKNKEGIDADEILPQLPKTTRVMHDHNLVNYKRITQSIMPLFQSYIETCKRNGINEMSALVRLCQGNPLSLSEIPQHNQLVS